MQRSSEKCIEIKTDLDKAKRVYRAAVEAIRRLDEGLKQKKAYREVFLQDAVGLRYKLKEYCERLMFYNPLEYGRKAEEVLWRKVFYDIIQLIKHNRRHVRPGSSLETAYRTHLSSASGYYYHLLFRFQRDFELKLNNQLDFPLLQDTSPGRFGKAQLRKREVTPMIQDWALKACHRCLICLGDIARYQSEFDSGMSAATSERFYQQALALFPDIGMPHNQLGTLSSSRYFHCEAAYHYIRCMVCEKAFEGAEGNLQRLFEKNQKRFQDLKQATPTSNPEEQCYNDLKGFFIHFLNLLRIFLDPSDTDSHEVQECCQSTLQSFNLCMFYEPVLYSEDLQAETLHYLEDDMVFKVVVICMATIHLLQTRGSRKVTAATAFLLALFSHILNHVVIRLQGALYEKENPNKLLQSNHPYDLCNGDDSESDTSGSRKEERQKDVYLPQSKSGRQSPFTGKQLSPRTQNPDKQPKKGRTVKMRSLRRRRKRPSRVESDDSLSDLSDLSEGNDDIDENIVSDESEDEIPGFYNHDSDSDLSDSLMESQELEPGFAGDPTRTDSNLDNTTPSSSQDRGQTLYSDSMEDKIWSEKGRESLANFSSELFSTSVPFIGQNFKFSQQNMFDRDIEEYETYKDVIQGHKEVSVPPGFATTTEARHVAEISHKLANFIIETDTEASVTATEGEMSTETEVEDYSSDENEKIASEEEKEIVHQQNVIEVIQGEGLMCVVKVMCDWMKCNAGVIMTCAQSSQSVWCRLSVLLNFLPSEDVYIQHDQCWVEELRLVMAEVTSLDWNQNIPLREDITLMQFQPLTDVHQTISMKSTTRLSDLQESFLRTCCLRQFGYFLSCLEGLQFSYHADKGLFIGPTQPTTTEDSQQIAMEKMADAESRRNQLMRDMAQLRLQAEVSQLEGTLSTTDTPPFPPYMIPDTSSLCTALPLIRQLSQTSRSILVIPLAVIDTLDFQKKESSGAREAIRWLESEFRKGNRYIRAQKSSEKVQASVPRHLKKKNRDAWCILEILNCALYLSQQGGDFGTGTVIAILTTGDFFLNNNQLVKQALVSSQQEGVAVEKISDFVNKWKDLLKSKG